MNLANDTVGDLVVISDHLNLPGLCGMNPLMGPNEAEFGERFIPMSDAYDLSLRKSVFRAAKQLGTLQKVHEGTYAMVSGPNYETRAECRALQTLGADVVGMSTIPEVLVARHCRMRVLGKSFKQSFLGQGYMS